MVHDLGPPYTHNMLLQQIFYVTEIHASIVDAKFNHVVKCLIELPNTEDNNCNDVFVHTMKLAQICVYARAVRSCLLRD